MGTRDQQPEKTHEHQIQPTVTDPLTPSKEAGLPGSLLSNRYLIQKSLGRGGIGIVYLAHDQQLLSRPVVIKVLLDEVDESDNHAWFKKKFRQEIEALARIDHPGVVGVLDAGELPDGKAYLVMQYVDGVTLRSVMDDRGMPLERAANILRQVGQALTAAHEKGVYHRDVKPENIMLQPMSDGEEQVRLIDFGIATVRDSQIAAEKNVTKAAGTLPYMSPEQLRGKPAVSSDVYSMGVVAYEMITGQHPFQIETGYELLEHQKAGVSTLPRNLRPELTEEAQAAILKALSYDPEQRYQRARDFGNELSRLLAGMSVTGATEPSRPPASQTPTGRSSTNPPTVVRETPVAAKVTNEAPVSPTVRSDQPRKNWLPVAALAVIALAALITLGIFLTRSNTSGQTSGSNQPVSNQPAPAAERSLNYWVTLFRNRNGRLQELARLHGETVAFEVGDRIQFTLSSPQSGSLYIVNEMPQTAAGVTRYIALFPLPMVNSGSSRVEANQQLELPRFKFDSEKGTETLWLVWSEQSIPALEALKKWVNERDQGEIKDAADQTAVRDFLKNNVTTSPELKNDDQKELTTVKGGGNLLVVPVKFKHI
ncbi:MAG TPA: protein kinase [Blastocatellia bacterium]|nr:protein kinase [Blastocatellia bacterium]